MTDIPNTLIEVIGDFDVHAPISHQEMVELGEGTHWDIANPKTDQWWNKYGKDDAIIIFINRKTGDKYAYAEITDEVINSDNSTSDLLDTYPELSEFINEEIN